MTDAFESVNYCDVLRAMVDGQADLTGEPAGGHKICEEVEWAWLVVGRNELRSCAEVY